MNCTTLSQLFVHLQNFDESVAWSKSVLHARCRVCKNRGDADRMLLCYKCDNGHHIYCLRPALPCLPEGEWFCPECKPKAVEKAPRKIRKSFIANVQDENGLYSDEGENSQSNENKIYKDEDNNDRDESEDGESPVKSKSKKTRKNQVVDDAAEKMSVNGDEEDNLETENEDNDQDETFQLNKKKKTKKVNNNNKSRPNVVISKTSEKKLVLRYEIFFLF